MDKTLSEGSLYWTIYVPQKMLAFSIGLKDLKNKKSVNFDFSLKKPTHLTFKVDIEKSIFSVLILNRCTFLYNVFISVYFINIYHFHHTQKMSCPVHQLTCTHSLHIAYTITQ